MTTTNHIIPKGPSGYPIIGNLFNIASNQRLVWLQAMADQYGDLVKFRLLKKEMYLVNHPDLVREVLAKKANNFTKRTVAFSVVKKVLGENTFTAMGDVWKRKRQLVQPSFHKTKIANLTEVMTDAIGEMLEDWEKICDQKETIDIADAMMRLTLNVVVRALFSTALTKEEVQTVADVFTPLLEETSTRASYPLKFYEDFELAKMLLLERR